jgi:hypothetical protein
VNCKTGTRPERADLLQPAIGVSRECGPLGSVRCDLFSPDDPH